MLRHIFLPGVADCELRHLNKSTAAVHGSHRTYFRAVTFDRDDNGDGSLHDQSVLRLSCFFHQRLVNSALKHQRH